MNKFIIILLLITIGCNTDPVLPHNNVEIPILQKATGEVDHITGNIMVVKLDNNGQYITYTIAHDNEAAIGNSGKIYVIINYDKQGRGHSIDKWSSNPLKLSNELCQSENELIENRKQCCLPGQCIHHSK